MSSRPELPVRFGAAMDVRRAVAYRETRSYRENYYVDQAKYYACKRSRNLILRTHMNK